MKKRKKPFGAKPLFFFGIIICVVLTTIGLYTLKINKLASKKVIAVPLLTVIPTPNPNWKIYHGDLYTITYPPNYFIKESNGEGFTHFQTGEGDKWIDITVDSRETGALSNFNNAKKSEHNNLYNTTQTNLPNVIAFTGMEGNPDYEQVHVTYAIYNDDNKAIEVSMRSLKPLSFPAIEPILLQFHPNTPQEIADFRNQDIQLYTNTILDFSIQYPGKWLVDENKNSVSFIESVNSLGGETGDTLQGGIIRIYPNYNPKISLLEYLHSVGELRITIDKEENTTINGIPVIWYSKTSENLSKTKFEGVVLKKNNKYFIIEATYAPQDRQEIINVLDGIVSNFTSPVK